MYAPPRPLSAEPPIQLNAGLRTANRRAKGQVADQPRLELVEPVRLSETADQPRSGRLSAVLAHPRFKAGGLAVCVIVALGYIAATYRLDEFIAGRTGISIAPDPSRASEQLSDAGATEQSLRVVPSSFDPVLVEQLNLANAIATGGELAESPNTPLVTTEMLRILAGMTPEQIDALTFMLLSQQDPAAAALAATPAAEGEPNPAADAPWIGDWTSAEQLGEPSETIEPLLPMPQNAALIGWHVTEASADEAVIMQDGNPLTAIKVGRGTVLGDLGAVSDILIVNGAAKVILSNGDEISSEAGTVIKAAAPAAAAPVTDDTATDERFGPPFEISLSTASAPQTSLEAPPDPEQLPAAAVYEAKDEIAPSDTSVTAKDTSDITPLQTAKATEAPFTDGTLAAATGEGYVQVGLFKSESNAERARDMLQSDGFAVQLRTSDRAGTTYHRVVAGPFEQSELGSALGKVNALGFKDAYVVR